MKNTLEEWFLSIGRTKYKVVTPKPQDFGIHDIFPCPGSDDFWSGMVLEKLPYMWHESEVHVLVKKWMSLTLYENEDISVHQ